MVEFEFYLHGGRSSQECMSYFLSFNNVSFISLLRLCVSQRALECHSIEFLGNAKSFVIALLFFPFFFSPVFLDGPMEVFLHLGLTQKASAIAFVFLLLLLVIVFGQTDGMFS